MRTSKRQQTATVQLPTLKELYKAHGRWTSDTEALERKADDTREEFRRERKGAFSQELIDACVDVILRHITPQRIAWMADSFIERGIQTEHASFSVSIHGYKVAEGRIMTLFVVEHNNRKRKEWLTLEISRDDRARYGDDVTREVTSRLPRDITELVEVRIQTEPPRYAYNDSADVGVNLTLKIRPEPGSESS